MPTPDLAGLRADVVRAIWDERFARAGDLFGVRGSPVEAAADRIMERVRPAYEALEAGVFALNDERVRWGRDGDCWDACAGVDHDPDCESTRIARDKMASALAAARTNGGQS